MLTQDFNDPQFIALFNETPIWSARFGFFMMQHLELRNHIRVMDLGCGAGFPLFELAYMHGPDCELIGLDTWQPALDYAEQRRAYFGLNHVQVVAYDGGVFPFPNGHFDLIVSNLGVNNFENPRATLAECARVCKPGARLVITTNIQGHMQAFYMLYRQVLEEFGNEVYLKRLEIHEQHRGTPESHIALIQQAGFHIERTIEDQTIMRYVNGTALFAHPLIRFAFMPAWVSLIEPDDQEAIFTQLEARLNEYAEAHGDLRLAIPMLYIEATQPSHNPAVSGS